MFLKKSTTQAFAISGKALFNVILLIIFFWIVSRPLKGIGEKLYGFFGKTAHTTYQNISESRSNVNQLFKANELLNKQEETITKLNFKLNNIGSEIKENKELKSLLKIKKDLNYRTLSARIIGRSADNWHKQVIIDKGLNENIMIGDSVLSNKGIVGQIVEVNKQTSTIQLISDPSFKLGCKIVDKDLIGIVKGKTTSYGLLKYIPVGSNIKIGDKVVTSGITVSNLAPTFPKGYPIGKVSRVSKKKNKFSDLYIEVKLYEDLTKLSNVLIFSPI
ncbi:MAG: rod shape-determining protein MreC [Candidatus Melainabacteria bacterium]|nr:rod shape-determining protein MreC [Candidatus Melainabacteria bacterium]